MIRSSILIIAPSTGRGRHLIAAIHSMRCIVTSTEAALCQSFLLAMSGHAGPIQMDLGVTPFVYRISLGQAVALLKGRRARRADLTGRSLSNRASDGDYGQPKSRHGRCQSKLRRGLGEQPRNFVSLWFR